MCRRSGGVWDSGIALPSGETSDVDPHNRDILVAGGVADRIYRYSGGSWDTGIVIPVISLRIQGSMAPRFARQTATSLPHRKQYVAERRRQGIGANAWSQFYRTLGRAHPTRHRDRGRRGHSRRWPAQRPKSVVVAADRGAQPYLRCPTEERRPSRSNGNLLMVARDTHRIYRYAGNAWDSGITLPSGEKSPQGLAVDNFEPPSPRGDR